MYYHLSWMYPWYWYTQIPAIYLQEFGIDLISEDKKLNMENKIDSVIFTVVPQNK